MCNDVLVGSLAGVDAGDEIGDLCRRGERRSRLALHHGQVLAHEWEASDRTSERLAVARELGGDDERTPHQARGADGIQPAGRIQHADSSLEALFQRAERVGRRTLELDLPGRERASAQLVLQPPDAEAAARAWHKKATEPARSGRGTP